MTRHNAIIASQLAVASRTKLAASTSTFSRRKNEKKQGSAIRHRIGHHGDRIQHHDGGGLALATGTREISHHNTRLARVNLLLILGRPRVAVDAQSNLYRLD